MRPSIYISTILGTSVRPRAPPNAVPRQTRPVTSWNGLVEISLPAPATPIITLSPQPFVAALKCSAHDVNVTDALERIVCTATGQFNQVIDKLVAMLCGVDKICHAELPADSLLAVVQIDTDNLLRADQSKP